MTFRMFNWIDVRLKASHDLKFCYEPSKKYSKEGIGRITILDIDWDTDIEKFLIRSEFEIKRYQPGYYNFYLFDEITKEKFVMYDADKYNEEVRMISEKSIIEKLRECKTKEQLFAIMEVTSSNDMKFWGEDNYKAARGYLKRAMGDPETHYGPQHGHLSEEEMFYMDVEMFLTRNWEYPVALRARDTENANNWGGVVATGGQNEITACVPNVEQYKVYRVYPCDCAYVGYSLVAANSVEDANRIIQDFKNSDPHNDRDSYAYGGVSESNLIEDLISTREGIILEGFHYTGN